LLDHITRTETPDLAAYLRATGQIDATGLARAEAVMMETGQRLAAVLVQLGLIGERSLAQAYAAMLSLRLLGPADYPLAPILPERLRPRFLRDALVVPIKIDGDGLELAMVDPTQVFARDAVDVVIAGETSMEESASF
jgi:general secretion pathway protein E